MNAPATTLDRRLTAARSDLAAEALRGLVDAPRYAQGFLRRVVDPVADLRREPRPDAPLDTQALAGEAVTVYDEHEGWAWGQLAGDGYVGYLPAAALGPADPAPTHRVTVQRTFVYPGPSIKLPPLAAVSVNSGFAVARTEGDFAVLATGGFVYAAHLSPLDTEAPDFVAVAERFLGVPYLWGGKTSLGIDCSGLVQVALAAAGIAAPRDSDMQEAGLGRPMDIAPDLAGLKRGDLVFWKSHVGIMLDAVRLLHANGHHMLVVAEPLAEAATRILARNGGPITSVRRL
ncbi:NlpC/P60 family protein [Chelatococcus sp. SYSU_G07232]|uniref:NlpC/P60 family protein n=1 Tax=Chelatococcus albus TaxID=3047466 RepID=A0ABT7AE27_9HYPH|nr:NlpC/P60 family protein [Chelatococcus sp. SYSU_G07232]MDJ1157609.1 NlpC/P60 family protein [Chelatococcus sp. SYSU_G07232]